MKKIVCLLLVLVVLLTCSCEKTEQEEGDRITYIVYDIQTLGKDWRLLQEIDTSSVSQVMKPMLNGKIQDLEFLMLPTLKFEGFDFHHLEVTPTFLFFYYKPVEMVDFDDDSAIMITQARYTETLTRRLERDNLVFDGDAVYDYENDYLLVNYNGYALTFSCPESVQFDSVQEMRNAIEWTRYTIEELETMTFETE